MKQLLIGALLAIPVCAQITDIQGSDQISGSRAVINSNFGWLNTNKAPLNPYTCTATTTTLTVANSADIQLGKGNARTTISAGGSRTAANPTGPSGSGLSGTATVWVDPTDGQHYIEWTGSITATLSGLSSSTVPDGSRRICEVSLTESGTSTTYVFDTSPANRWTGGYSAKKITEGEGISVDATDDEVTINLL
jgi:hypothetical protein